MLVDSTKSFHKHTICFHQRTLKEIILVVCFKQNRVQGQQVKQKLSSTVCNFSPIKTCHVACMCTARHSKCLVRHCMFIFGTIVFCKLLSLVCSVTSSGINIAFCCSYEDYKQTKLCLSSNQLSSCHQVRTRFGTRRKLSLQLFPKG